MGRGGERRRTVLPMQTFCSLLRASCSVDLCNLLKGIDDHPARLAARFPRVVEGPARTAAHFLQPGGNFIAVGEHGRQQQEISVRRTLQYMQEAQHGVDASSPAALLAE